MWWTPYATIFMLVLSLAGAWINGASKGYREGEKDGYDKGVEEGKKLAERRYG